MAVSPDKLNPEPGETERLVEDFRQKVIQSLERERTKLREIAEKDAKLILTRAYQESASITAKCQEQAKQIMNQAKQQADQEVESIMSQARERAQQVVNNAEEICRREAKEKTRKEAENILRSAREESGKLTTKALQEAKDQANSLIVEARKQATVAAREVMESAEEAKEKLYQDAAELKQKAGAALAEAQKKAEEAKAQILETARKNAIDKAEKETLDIIAQAKLKAEKEREILLANALAEAKKSADAETSRVLSRARQEAEEIINEAKNKVRIQLEESSKLMVEIQQKMFQVIGTAGLDMKKTDPRNESPAPASLAQSNAPSNRPLKEPGVHSPAPSTESPAVNQAQNKLNSIYYDDANKTYQGRLKIDIAPPVDSEQVTQLEQHLLKTPDIKVLGKGGAEDGSAWIDMEAVRPVPLVEILKKVPAVKDVVGAKSYIIVALKAKQLV